MADGCFEEHFGRVEGIGWGDGDGEGPEAAFVYVRMGEIEGDGESTNLRRRCLRRLS